MGFHISFGLSAFNDSDFLDVELYYFYKNNKIIPAGLINYDGTFGAGHVL